MVDSLFCPLGHFSLIHCFTELLSLISQNWNKCEFIIFFDAQDWNRIVPIKSKNVCCWPRMQVFCLTPLFSECKKGTSVGFPFFSDIVF